MARKALEKAVHAGVLAEAASMPLHWIYDAQKLKDTVGSKDPEFFEPLSCPFYEHTAGQWSPYGAEAAATAAALVAAGPEFDGQEACKAFEAWFQTWTGYRNHSAKTAIANVQAGKPFPLAADAGDTQVNSCVKVPIAMLAYKERDWQSKLPSVFQLTQSQSLPLSCGLAFAAILDQVVEGATPLDAAKAFVEDKKTPSDQKALVQDVLDNQNGDLSAMCSKWGPSCQLPGAFKLALLVALQADNYLDGVRKNILLGGDNCSRAVIIGSLLSPSADEELLATFASKTNGFAEIKALTSKLAAF
eukprot:TRINITY_DN2396_c0_g1_i2.p1 TRINITY_DN2396_c0_g1~~TRINITY_DN2396_c0_g1_i2.p1  ORF type:complete len:334 (+),score=85.34 TRINITY_DN2396_c0_g1_i2:95-1003(+)